MQGKKITFFGHRVSPKLSIFSLDFKVLNSIARELVSREIIYAGGI